MLYDVFCSVIKMSVAACIPGAIILILKAVLQKIGFSRSHLMLLYLLIALRLLCPALPESNLSIFNIAENHRGEASVVYNKSSQSFDYSYEASEIKKDDGSVYQMVHLASSNGDANKMLLSFIWLGGCIAMGFYMLFSWVMLKRKLRFAVKYDEGIFYSENIFSSFVFGIFKPKIYIPYGVSEENRENIVAHEKMHIKRLDHITKLAAWAILSVHWFNPFVWLVLRCFSYDIELACDEAVIKNKGDIASYLNSMLEFSKFEDKKEANTTICSFSNQIRLRAKNLAGYKSKPLYIQLLSIIICVFLFPIFGTDAYVAKIPASNKIGDLKDDNFTANLSFPKLNLSPEKTAPQTPDEAPQALPTVRTKQFEYKTNLTSDDLYMGYELLSYEKINMETIESSLKNNGIAFSNGKAELDRSYTKGSYTWTDGEICSSDIKCDENGNISLYFDLNSESLMQVSIFDSSTGQKVDEAVVVANGKNVYSFLGYDSNHTYNITIKSSTDNEWKINGQYIIY